MMKNFFIPIVNVNVPPDGSIQLYSYIINKHRKLHKQPIIVEQKAEETTEDILPETRTKLPEDIFDRIKRFYPLEALKRKTVVCVGCGGTRQFIEDMVRSGVGNYVLIDGDSVSATNIATQQVYVSEIDQKKVIALQKRIMDINPTTSVKVIPRFLDDFMTDSEFENIVGVPLIESPTDVLICGCTDNFYAQARAAALAMKYGTLYLAGQLYKGGMGAEIYFSYPGVTNNSCPRCAMSSRYEAYANGYRNDVTSSGTPIFATTRVNSLKGQIALMLLLYHEDKNCVYNDMLDRVANRNFVMLRMSPLADKALGTDVFREAFSDASGLCFFDETVWIPQEPNNEANGNVRCPLCGGTGDLLSIKGKPRDTRTDW